ncbi:MAG: glutamine amidotransferase [Acidimicrobiales bacterium]|jgi:CobQ-like glutamine amidotransferase family enzyme|nr:glutamine amidotransferase [Acidimicrobiales bacterium]
MTAGAGGASTVRIGVLYPDLLGTYGDGGNAVVLARRLAWRGIPAELVTVRGGEVAPDSCDLYLVGGGEDGPQTQAAKDLAESRALHRAVEAGAVVLAVCAGMQILGHRFPDATGTDRPGLGLLDCTTIRVDRPRAVGELLTGSATVPDPAGDPIALGALTGFENHAGRSVVGPDSSTLAAVEVGEGNGDGYEGVVRGRVVGTYLHGPVLARNPVLADLLLGWVVGREALTPLDDHEVDRLRDERLRAARDHELAPRRSWRDALRRS